VCACADTTAEQNEKRNSLSSLSEETAKKIKASRRKK